MSKISDLPPCDIVAITAHPDDMELNCSGTLALAVRAGWKASAIDVTRGELSTRGTPERRAEEARTAAVELGLTTRANLELPDGHLHDGDETRRAVVRTLRTMRPKVVLTPPLNDHHADHMAVAEIVTRSFYLAGVANYDPGIEPWRPHALFYYVGSRADIPTMVVDVSSTYEQRLAAIRRYESQFFKEGSTERRTRISHPYFLDAIDGTARRFGALIGVQYGEAFTSPEPLPVRDLVGLYATPPWEEA